MRNTANAAEYRAVRLRCMIGAEDWSGREVRLERNTGAEEMYDPSGRLERKR